MVRQDNVLDAVMEIPVRDGDMVGVNLTDRCSGKYDSYAPEVCQPLPGVPTITGRAPGSAAF